MPKRSQADELSLEETTTRFHELGFDLAIREIATGRYSAVATIRRRKGAGPIAVRDSLAAAAMAAWRRFEIHRSHYLELSEQDT
jgi:hypothetical protein